MNKTELIQKIERLLRNSGVVPSIAYTSKDGIHENCLISEHPENYTFSHSQSCYLKRLYLQLNIIDKKAFEDCLLEWFENNSFPNESYCALLTLIHIGKFQDVFQKIENGLTWTTDYAYIRGLQVICTILSYEWPILNEIEIESLEKWCIETKSGKGKTGEKINYSNMNHVKLLVEKIGQQVNIVLTKNIEKEIDFGYNPEINVDKENLKQEIAGFDFPKELIAIIDEIDSKFNSARSRFDYKGCMDLIRSFTELFYKSVAIEIDPINGKNMDEKKSESIAKFFKENNFMNGDQTDLLVSLRHFLSNSGSHKLQSQPEDARLSRNMAVEFSLYVLKRVRDYKGITQ